jgi:NAD(P)-dependent dehydrogenase (short-subunit alcohol dehydrogenase family)
MKKTILITGSTDGIGKLAAIKLAKDGHKILVHGRKSDKLTAVVEEIKALSNNENIKGYLADFSDLDAVKNMATAITNDYSTIDVLINNAGVFKSPVATNQDGIDLRVMVNYYAPYVLTNALLPLLKNASTARIVNLSSAAQSAIHPDLFTGKINRPEMDAYSQSKLAITMWSFHLANQLKNISVIPVNPGSLLDTNMVREGFGRVWSSADKGADILYDLAVAGKYEGVSGKYFDNDRGSFGMAHSDAYDQEKVKSLIEITENFLH